MAAPGALGTNTQRMQKPITRARVACRSACAHAGGLTTSSGRLGGAWSTYNVYPTRDGWIAVAALEPQFRAALAWEQGVEVD